MQCKAGFELRPEAKAVTRMYLIMLSGWTVLASAAIAQTPGREPPADWGSDHVGQPVPAYMTGDECLFCHRRVGSNWSQNPHQLTIRTMALDEPLMGELKRLPAGPELVEQSDYVLGGRHRLRLLRRAAEYGEFHMWSATLLKQSSQSDAPLRSTERLRWSATADPHWDKLTYGNNCAGCHTTGVDVVTRSFSAVSLDCFTCHGDVQLQHTDKENHVLLSAENRQPRQVVSICGQCHLRGGKSRSSGRPYPNNFVAGDNLFLDFEVDFNALAADQVSATDRHIFVNVRDVALLRKQRVTCLTCHDVHDNKTVRHQELALESQCYTCHEGDLSDLRLTEAFQRERDSGYVNPVCAHGSKESR